MYEQALVRDPQFALAAAALGRAHMLMYFGAQDRSETRLAAAKQAIDRALALQPDLGEAHFALGLYNYWGHHDYTAALQQFELAKRALPNDVEVDSLFAYIARRRGQWAIAMQGLQQATLLDPRRPDFFVQLALTYQIQRRYEDAEAAYDRAAAVTHDPLGIQLDRANNALLWKGDLAPLRKALAPFAPGSDGYLDNVDSFYILYWMSRDFGAAARTASVYQEALWPDQSNVVLPRELYEAWALRAADEAEPARALFAKVRQDMQAAAAKDPSDPDTQAALGFAEAGLGNKTEAVSAAIRATQLRPLERDALSGAGYLVRLAQVYVQVGDNDRAIALLQRLLTIPAGSILSPSTLKLDPVWDTLRHDPRFRALLAKPRAV